MLPGRPLALGVDFDPALPDRAHQCLVVVLVLSGIADSEVGYSLLELIALARRFYLSVSRHTHQIDPGNLALRVEAQQKAGRVATRKEKLYHVECLLSDVLAFRTWAPNGDAPFAQIYEELASTAMDHLLCEVFQSRTVCRRTVSLHSNPHDAIRTTYQYFRFRIHRFVRPVSFVLHC